MLLTRVLAAAAFTPALVALLWVGGTPLRAALVVLSLLMLWEYSRMLLAPLPPAAAGGFWVAGGALAAWHAGLAAAPPAPLPALLAAGLALTIALTRTGPLAARVHEAGLMLLGWTVCCLPLGALAALRSRGGDGQGLSLLALLATWGADTGAYFAGRACGRRRLAPTISPNKTWEGFAGGLAAAMAAAAAIHRLLALSLPGPVCVGLGAVAATTGLVGDLCESMLKRSAGAKDSSHLIPGHGGVLDRFDGVLFAAPAVYACSLCCYPSGLS